MRIVLILMLFQFSVVSANQIDTIRYDSTQYITYVWDSLFSHDWCMSCLENLRIQGKYLKDSIYRNQSAKEYYRNCMEREKKTGRAIPDTPYVVQAQNRLKIELDKLGEFQYDSLSLAFYHDNQYPKIKEKIVFIKKNYRLAGYSKKLDRWEQYVRDLEDAVRRYKMYCELLKKRVPDVTGKILQDNMQNYTFTWEKEAFSRQSKTDVFYGYSLMAYTISPQISIPEKEKFLYRIKNEKFLMFCYTYQGLLQPLQLNDSIFFDMIDFISNFSENDFDIAINWELGTYPVWDKPLSYLKKEYRNVRKFKTKKNLSIKQKEILKSKINFLKSEKVLYYLNLYERYFVNFELEDHKQSVIDTHCDEIHWHRRLIAFIEGGK